MTTATQIHCGQCQGSGAHPWRWNERCAGCGGRGCYVVMPEAAILAAQRAAVARVRGAA
ncbi:hypothetical protein GCM10012275_64900 [Longimycelium tulufanense]|uniref:Uncharacterized protein n=1 Tax=Longimycelium tulufanense TaxID=907463 RepID=A0A8J3CL22_9PSEU|nr:hypothetical protein [Longimycelium tulufanense]GGM85177.1 hypothetical protein GCM10012275_64900 [Longimycelium tulufanense]